MYVNDPDNWSFRFIDQPKELLDRLAVLAKPKPFPLWALLYLYYHAHLKDVYVNHFTGFKLLVDWLEPIEVPADIGVQLPRYCGNYELQEIAIILSTHQHILYQTLKAHDDKFH